MKVMTIRIRSKKALWKDVVKAVRTRQPLKPKTAVYFTSLEAARNFLTPKRLELLRAIKAKNPKSIYGLAKIMRRNFSSVLKDVELLTRHGLVKLTKDRQSRRRAVHDRRRDPGSRHFGQGGRRASSGDGTRSGDARSRRHASGGYLVSKGAPALTRGALARGPP